MKLTPLKFTEDGTGLANLFAGDIQEMITCLIEDDLAKSFPELVAGSRHEILVCVCMTMLRAATAGLSNPDEMVSLVERHSRLCQRHKE